MWWKIYFWINLVVTVLGLLLFLSTFSSWNFASWLSSAEGIVFVLGLYSYVFKKKIFNKTAWKYIFLVTLIDTVLHLVYTFTKMPLLSILNPNTTPEVSVAGEIFGLVINVPVFVVVYRLGFNSQKLKINKKKK